MIRSRRPGFPSRLLLATSAAFFAFAAPSAFGQDPFVFEERLFGAPNARLDDGETYSGGQEPWEVEILGGDLFVEEGKFERKTASGLFTSATVSHVSFPPFVSDSWVMRAEIRGTNPTTISADNSVTLAADGPAGGYGARVVINRSDGQPDLNFGHAPNFNDRHNAEHFAFGQLVGREIRLTLVNLASNLHVFVDDLAAATPPTNFHVPGSSPGALGAAQWDRARVVFGARFTGTVDRVQFYAVRPFVETFTIAETDPIAAFNLFDNPWNVADANAPVGWAIANGATGGPLLHWKAAGATFDPHVFAEGPATNFMSDSWLLEATLVFHLPTNNSGNHRAVFEMEAADETLGIVAPRDRKNGARLFVYRGTESNVVATSGVGTDLIRDVPYRFSAAYNRGELLIRLNDRALAVGAAYVGVGFRDWRRLRFKSHFEFPISIDNVLLLNAGSGIAASGPEWVAFD